MLVLTRKLGEEICIGENIKITVVLIKGKTVRIGVEAPREVDVHRSEVKELMKTEGKNEGEINAV